MVNGLQSDGAVQSYFNDAMSQEVSYQTSGIGAETSAGGVRLNMIPREGGNKFSGAFFSSWRDGALAVGQLLAGPEGSRPAERQPDRPHLRLSTSRRAARSRRTSCGSSRRLRNWSVNAPIAGTFVTDGSGPAIASCLAAAKTSSPCDQGIDDQRIRSVPGCA